MTEHCSNVTEMKSSTSSDGFMRSVLSFLLSPAFLLLDCWCESSDCSTYMWTTLLQVSSVTQTTVTEKEVLSQLLQEKDQLRREQEDRIKNLTKLLVTSSNLVPVHKVSETQNKTALKKFSLRYHSQWSLFCILRCQSAG